MAIFGNKKDHSGAASNKETTTEYVRKKSPSSAVTIITAGSQFTGAINGIDSVHVDGHIKGDIIVENGIIIGKSGTVEGNIHAKKVVISGELNGSIVCEDLEVMKGGKVTHKIDAISVILDGKIMSDISAKDSIVITNNGEVESVQIYTNSLKVDGILYADNLETRFLEITTKGYLDCDMSVETIKIHKGGVFVGSIKEFAKD